MGIIRPEMALLVVHRPWNNVEAVRPGKDTCTVVLPMAFVIDEDPRAIMSATVRNYSPPSGIYAFVLFTWYALLCIHAKIYAEEKASLIMQIQAKI